MERYIITRCSIPAHIVIIIIPNTGIGNDRKSTVVIIPSIFVDGCGGHCSKLFGRDKYKSSFSGHTIIGFGSVN